MSNPESTRRRFLVAIVALAGTTAGVSLLQPIRAWAQTNRGARPAPDLVHFARNLYPHDALADDVYAEVLDSVLAATATDTAFATVLDDVEAVLESRLDNGFADASEADQIAAMQAVEGSAAFAKVRAAVRAGIYQHPACWEIIGYGGPSFQHGGYLHRGVGEIDWLPEGE